MTNWGEFPRIWPNASGKYAKLHRLIDKPRLPSGEWRMIANGRIYPLEVVDGEIVPTSGPGSARDKLTDITVDWVKGDSGTSLRIQFRRHAHSPKPNEVQEWIGYMMTSPVDSDEVYIDEKYRIAGTFVQKETSGRNHSGGWYATIDRADVRRTDEASDAT